jgi:hypothetical protein
LGQVLKPGRERREFMEPETRMLGDSSGYDLAPLFVGSEKGDG